MADKSIGFIETFGLAACVAAADAAVKSANVKLLGFEYAKGDGMCTVKVEGNVGACKAAVEAGKKAAEAVQGSLSGTKSVLLKARPAPSMRALLVDNRETVGGEIALAEGYRPKGDTKKPVLVKNWKPKNEEPKAETPMEEAPEPPVVEDLEEKSTDSAEVTEETVSTEEAPAEAKAPAETPEEAETPAEESEPENTESVVAPETEEPVPVAAPEEESKAEETAEEAKAPEETVSEEKAEEEPKKEAPAKKPSTGSRRSGRSRKKKNPES